MKPDRTWITAWGSGEAPAREREISRELLRIFIAFWEAQGLSQKSKTTKYRYSGALHSLGGYLVEQATGDDGRNKTAHELLAESVGPDDGPLICHDNETWQREIDMVCRRLHRYLRRTADEPQGAAARRARRVPAPGKVSRADARVRRPRRPWG